MMREARDMNPGITQDMLDRLFGNLLVIYLKSSETKLSSLTDDGLSINSLGCIRYFIIISMIHGISCSGAFPSTRRR